MASPFPATAGDSLRTATWNVAAVNNNPLEYWTTYDHPDYTQLMVSVEQLIDSPGDRDVRVRVCGCARARARA